MTIEEARRIVDDFEYDAWELLCLTGGLPDSYMEDPDWDALTEDEREHYDLEAYCLKYELLSEDEREELEWAEGMVDDVKRMSSGDQQDA